MCLCSGCYFVLSVFLARRSNGEGRFQYPKTALLDSKDTICYVLSIGCE